MTEQESHQGSITLETVRMAIMGAHIANSPDLCASYRGIPEECLRAAEAIQNNRPAFERLVLGRLAELPMTNHFFGQLISRRLKQRRVVASPILSALFDERESLEQRLCRVRSIPGASQLREEYRGSRDPRLGRDTDRDILKLDAEIVVLDFLMQLGFRDVRKAAGPKSKARIDITASQGGMQYAVEVTRKQEIRGWETLQYGNLEDCEALSNRRKIRKLLRRALAKKQKQFSRARQAVTIGAQSVRVIAIKTSDYGFAECIDQAIGIASLLLAEQNWPDIDCLWLLPNTNAQASRWLCRRADHLPPPFAAGQAEAAALPSQHLDTNACPG